MRILLLACTLSAACMTSCKGKRYTAGSASMENTIMTGQKFTVSPTATFNNDDIVVFDIYSNDYRSIDETTGEYKMHWEQRVFRLVASSGDSFEIKNGEVFVNGHLIPPPINGKARYEVHSAVAIPAFENDGYFTSAKLNGGIIEYITPLTEEEAKQYSANKDIIRVKRMLTEYSPSDTLVVRLHENCQWTDDKFGPLKIPSPGDTVFTDKVNYRLYRNIPGIHIGINIIKEKLYFVMGDNRSASEDSRYIGYIPHSKMVGIVK